MEILADAMPDKASIPRSTDGMVDIQSLLRLLAEQVVNAIMDEEADQLCGDGANSRNGYRDRSLETCVGTLNLRIPKLRTGSFFPEDVLERYQRVDRALRRGGGRDVRHRHQHQEGAEDSRRRWASRGSAGDRVSAIAATLDAEIADLAEGPLDARAIPYIWLDATYVKVPPRGPRGFDRSGHGDRLRRVRLEAGAGGVRGGHGVLRIVARFPAEAARPRRDRHRARRIRCPRGPGQGHRRGLPGGRPGSDAPCT